MLVAVRRWPTAPLLVPPVLLAMALTGCASSKPVKVLEEESRLTSVRLAEVQQATEELRKELASVVTLESRVRALESRLSRP